LRLGIKFIDRENLMSLSTKTALVTGSSRGIGRAIAHRLAMEGYDVVINYKNNKNQALEVVSLIKKEGVKALAVQADLADYNSVAKLVKKAETQLGPIGVLINNATTYKAGKVNKLPIEDWDLVLKSCLNGAFYCCRCVVPSMLKIGWGRIINISSTVGEHGFAGDTAYGTAKAGLLGFTKSLAKELAPYNINVNVVMPGFVITDMTKNLSEKSIELLKRTIPLGRPCNVKDISEMVIYLVSSGDYITGSIFHVDGGVGM
jgi:3-oxoacyl-[acyl-carrier protein] reductase